MADKKATSKAAPKPKAVSKEITTFNQLVDKTIKAHGLEVGEGKTITDEALKAFKKAGKGVKFDPIKVGAEEGALKEATATFASHLEHTMKTDKALKMFGEHLETAKALPKNAAGIFSKITKKVPAAQLLKDMKGEKFAMANPTVKLAVATGLGLAGLYALSSGGDRQQEAAR